MLLAFLFLLFTVVPVVELTLLYLLGSSIGMWPTLALLLLTGVAGVALARWQGTKALLRIQRRLARGQLPASELFDQVLILVAGILLVVPGILTDVVGLTLLIPPMRSLIKRRLRDWAKGQVEVRTSQVHGQFWTHVEKVQGPHRRDEIIDAEVIETRVIE